MKSLRFKCAPVGCLAAGLLAVAVFAPGAWAQQTTRNSNPAASSAPASPSASAAPASTPDTAGPASTPDTASPASTPDTAGPASTPDTDGPSSGPSSSGSQQYPLMPGVKKGSIDDVNAVGTRDIGARGVGNWYSTESEIRMGKQYASELEKSVKFITDPVVDEYVNRVGQNIVKNSDCKVPFTIKVIDSDEVNAMALPGGFFYVNSGLILAADNEAELAGVMAHETAHVCAHHVAREQTRMNYAQLGTIPLIFIGGWTGYGIYEAANIGIPLTFLQFSRDFETQADFLGVQYMYRAGYDPEAFVTIFEKLENLQKTKPNLIAKAFSSHPQTPDRIEATEKEIATILPPRDEYVVNTSEFADVKARLARIENKRRLKPGQIGNQPSLRRASNNGSTSPNSQGGDRPTLERRDESN